MQTMFLLVFVVIVVVLCIRDISHDINVALLRMGELVNDAESERRYHSMQTQPHCVRRFLFD